MGNRNRAGLDPIARLRRRAARLIWAERLARAAAPAGFLIAVYFAAVLFGLANPWAFAALMLLAVLSLAIGLIRLRPPAPAAIDRRIETASGLKHRPLAMLDDEPETDNPVALALWAAHRQRVLATLGGAKIGAPAPQAAFQDPWALRALLLLLLITGIVIAGPAMPGRLASAFALPSWPIAGPTVTAWITPPDYAGQPPQVLEPGEDVTALPGSKVTVIIDGPHDAPGIRLSGAKLPQTRLADDSHRADATLQNSGQLLVGPWWHRLAQWNIRIVPPASPVISVTGIEISNGNHVKLHWNVTDPYGLQSVAAVVAPEHAPDALAQVFSLPTNTGDAAGVIDLSTSPFHGLPVDVTVTARNEAGVAASANWSTALMLPGLPLHDPTAIALDHLRQSLAVEPKRIIATTTAMQLLSQEPPSQITPAADVKLAVLTCAMWLGQTGPAAALPRMLALIEEMEAGPGYAAAQALQQASQALTAALQRGLNGQAPDSAALQKLLQSVMQAMQQQLAAGQQNGGAIPGGQTVDPSTLEQMARKIAADEAAGRTEQAARELQQLQSLLNNLANAKPMTAQQMAQAQAAQAAAKALAQLAQGEAALLNKTQQGQGTAGAQAALQQQLNQTAQALAKAGLNVPGLAQAGTAMGAAKDALSQQDDATAQAEENAAIQALQQAESAIAQMQSHEFNIGAAPTAPSGQDQTGVNGGPDEESTPLDTYGTANPARAIEQQIINQDAAPSLPAPTRDYYQRLLQNGGSGP